MAVQNKIITILLVFLTSCTTPYTPVSTIQSPVPACPRLPSVSNHADSIAGPVASTEIHRKASPLLWVGHWQWFNPDGSFVDINADGTTIHTLDGKIIDTGHWMRRANRREITVNWSSNWSDDWVLASNGRSMSGHNQAVELPEVTKLDNGTLARNVSRDPGFGARHGAPGNYSSGPYVGLWAWFNPEGSFVRINADGTLVHMSGNNIIDTGHWSYLPGETGIVISWSSGWSDEWLLSADGKSMSGHNQMIHLPFVYRSGPGGGGPADRDIPHQNWTNI